MTEIERHACGPCKKGQCHQCRPEWDCPCPHIRTLTPAAATAAPSSPTDPTPVVEAGAALGAAAWRSAAEPAPVASSPFATGAPAFEVSPPFWGDGGCRHIAEPGHVCRTSLGMPIEPGQCCFEEAKSRLADDYPMAVGEGRIVGLVDVAARIAERLQPMARLAGRRRRPA